MNRSIGTLLPGLRAFLLLKTGLLQHRSLAAGGIAEVLVQEVENEAAIVLNGVADAIEAESPEPLVSRNARIEELGARVSIEDTTSREAKNLLKHTEMRLCASLLDVVSDSNGKRG